MSKAMIESVSSQLPDAQLTANEIMQRVHAMIQAMIIAAPIADPRPDAIEQLITDWIDLKREVWGSSEE